MSTLVDRLSRLRGMAIPMAVYLVITLVLPLANGAAARRDFAHHAGWVAAGCAAVAMLALLGMLAVELARDAVRRLRGGRS